MGVVVPASIWKVVSVGLFKIISIISSPGWITVCAIALTSKNIHNPRKTREISIKNFPFKRVYLKPLFRFFSFFNPPHIGLQAHPFHIQHLLLIQIELQTLHLLDNYKIHRYCHLHHTLIALRRLS